MGPDLKSFAPLRRTAPGKDGPDAAVRPRRKGDMPMAPPRDDKRRHPRVAKRIKVESADRKLQLETIDLSAGGLSCRAPVFLAPMTRMAISLVLPGNGGAEKTEQVVRGEAVVVRTEPEKGIAPPPDGFYRIALFFSRMDEPDRKRLQEYLKHLAGKNGSA